MGRSMRHRLVGMVEVEGLCLVFVQPQQPGSHQRDQRRLAASGGYIQTPWMLMQLRMIQG